MTRQTTDKANRLFNRLTNRYDRPNSPVADLAVASNEDGISVQIELSNSRYITLDLDPTRGILDLNRQVVTLINQVTA